MLRCNVVNPGTYRDEAQYYGIYFARLSPAMVSHDFHSACQTMATGVRLRIDAKAGHLLHY